MLTLHRHIRTGIALWLSLLFLVPFLGTTLHRYHAEEHVRVHQCDSQRQQQQHLHDPAVLGWHHCSLCTVPGFIATPIERTTAVATDPELRAEPATFAQQPPFLPARRQISPRGPPAIS